MRENGSMARSGLIAQNVVVRLRIFSGTPSQVINLPVFGKGIVAAAVIVAAYVYALARWPSPWVLPVVAFLFVFTSIGLGCLRTGNPGRLYSRCKGKISVFPFLPDVRWPND